MENTEDESDGAQSAELEDHGAHLNEYTPSCTHLELDSKNDEHLVTDAPNSTLAGLNATNGAYEAPDEGDELRVSLNVKDIPPQVHHAKAGADIRAANT